MDLADGRVIPVAGLLRAARAVADLSQRAVAARSGLSKGVISRMETDETGGQTSLASFVRALHACGVTVTIHADGRDLLPDDDPERDRGCRQYPPHLAPHALVDIGEWWAAQRTPWIVHTQDMPPRTFHLNPNRRTWCSDGDAVPWTARFWADQAHLAPPHHVHPSLQRARDRRRWLAEQVRRWDEREARARQEIERRAGEGRQTDATPEDGSAAGDGGAHEG